MVGWKLVDWDGNPDLGYKCWRKKLGRFTVSIGDGDFLTIVVHNYYSSTRWRPNGVLTVQEAAKEIEKKYRKDTLY